MSNNPKPILVIRHPRGISVEKIQESIKSIGDHLKEEYIVIGTTNNNDTYSFKVLGGKKFKKAVIELVKRDISNGSAKI